MSSQQKEKKRQNPYFVAFRFLSIRERSEKELFNKLREKKFSKKKIIAVINDLKKKKFIDDRLLAENFISYRLGFHPEGKFLLQHRLRQKMVKDEIIEDVLERLLSREKESQLSLLAAKKKIEILKNKNFSSQELKLKLSFFLHGRGFSKEIIDETFLNLKI